MNEITEKYNFDFTNFKKEKYDKKTLFYDGCILLAIRMLSVRASGEDCYKSTYNTFFKKLPKDTKPKKKFATYSGDLDVTNDQKEYIRPDTKRRSVHSLMNKNLGPPCLGLGCYGDVPIFNTDKPIVREARPQDKKIPIITEEDDQHDLDEKRNPLDRPLKEILDKYTWTTTKSKEDKPYCLPIKKFEIPDSTLEENADMVRYRPLRRDQVGDWQLAGRAWDRVQTRKTHFREKPDCVKKVDAANVKAAITAKKYAEPTPVSIVYEREPFSMAMQCKERKIPGYGGFVPEEPVESTFDSYTGRYYKTTMQRNFGPVNHNVMGNDKIRHIAVRKSPMSKMMALISPHNAFRNYPDSGMRSICY